MDNQPSVSFIRTIATYPRGTNPVTSVTPGVTTAITVMNNHNLQTGQIVILSSFNGTIGSQLNNLKAIVTVTSLTSFTILADTVGLVWTGGGLLWYPGFNPGNVTYTRIYLGAIAHMHQLEFTLNVSQILDPIQGRAQFEIQALVLWTRQEGRIRG